ncbi:MAG: ATP-binding protein, partial [Candidatus Poseidoniaceae archaeon]
MVPNDSRDEEVVDEEEDGVDINANLGEMFNNYEGLSYQLHDALAEYIDNSLDSFDKNSKALEAAGKTKLEIEITINNTKRALSFTDNAFGMDKEELKLALIPDRKNPDPNHLGMYGRGMKTASGWFGKLWKIETKKLGEDYEYTATVDIGSLLNPAERSNFIPITTKHVPGKPSQSYTRVTITKGTRKYFASTTSKAKELLSIKYQRWLTNNLLDINWVSKSKEEKLAYNEPDILVLKNPGYEAEKVGEEGYNEPENIEYDFDFDVEFKSGENKVSINGRYGVYPPQSNQARYAGLTMFWRNRVIIDRTREYWPESVFGKATGGLVRQRAFVHINTIMSPTSDKKDFKWDLFSFDELNKVLEGVHAGNIKKVANIGADLRTGQDKELTPQQVLAELQRLKALLESQATNDALIQSHPILQAGVTELTEEEEAALEAEDAPEINIQINHGSPTLTIKGNEMHKSDDFCKIRIE